MGELRTALYERLSVAYESMRTAHAGGQDDLVDVHEAEIEDLRRIALEHHIELPRQP
jgi:hypothetical protein